MEERQAGKAMFHWHTPPRGEGELGEGFAALEWLRLRYAALERLGRLEREVLEAKRRALRAEATARRRGRKLMKLRAEGKW